MAAEWAAFEWGSLEWAQDTGVVVEPEISGGGGGMGIGTLPRRRPQVSEREIMELILSGAI